MFWPRRSWSLTEPSAHTICAVGRLSGRGLEKDADKLEHDQGGTQDDIRSNPRRESCRNGLLKLGEKGPRVGGVGQDEVCLQLTSGTPRQEGKLILYQSRSGEGAGGGPEGQIL